VACAEILEGDISHQVMIEIVDAEERGPEVGGMTPSFTYPAETSTNNTAALSKPVSCYTQ